MLRQNSIIAPGLALISLFAVFAVMDSTVAAQSGGDNLQLVVAAMQGRAESVRSLLTQKVDVNVAQGDGMTALHWAVYKNDAEMARMLVDAGARVQAATRSDALTPLYMAASNGNASIITLLLKAGADANGLTSLGATPLMRAAASGSVDAVQILLDSGADLKAKDTIRAQTAVMFAAAMNRDSVIRLLASRGADLNATSKIIQVTETVDGDGNIVVPGAPQSSSLLFGGGLETMGGMTALHYAVREGNMEAVRALVAAGANVNEVNAGDKTTSMVQAIVNGYYDIARFLLEHGANPSLASVDGLEALYATIDNEHAPVSWSPTSRTWSDGTAQQETSYLDLMKLILERGVNPNVRITRRLWFRPPHHDQMWVKTPGSTAFWRAAQATDSAAMRLLLAYGADPTIASDENDTALHMAAGVGWQGNFSVNAPDPAGALDSMKLLLDLGLDVNAVDAQGYTPIMGAAYRGENDIVRYLASRGAKLNARNSRGWSVTDMATAPNLRGAGNGMSHPDTVALLASLGAPPPSRVDDEELLGVIKRKITDEGIPEAPVTGKPPEK